MISIRPEAPSDHEQVRLLNRLAFSGSDEAAIVDALRNEPRCISLVATDDDVVVGHIFMTPVEVVGPRSRTKVAGLGPMTVEPARQRQGIGSELVRAGIEASRRLGYEAIVLVGHPSYYPRFGFVRASAYGLRVGFDVPEEAFMALELKAGALAGGGGEVRYSVEFSKVRG